jgi:hypothetical protein
LKHFGMSQLQLRMSISLLLLLLVVLQQVKILVKWGDGQTDGRRSMSLLIIHSRSQERTLYRSSLLPFQRLQYLQFIHNDISNTK